MAQINVIRDPQIEQTQIATALRSPSPDEVPDANPDTEIQQTKVFGVLMPLLAMNGIVVDFGDVYQFELDYTGVVPRIKFAFRDRNNLMKNVSNPGNDNEFRVQIIPPSDNTYKKIDLTFMCNEISVQDGVVSGEGEYKLAKFTQSQFKALGQISTYELFDKISIETGLGFAANAEATEDARFMQCQFESYKDIIQREMPKSGSNEVHVYDWWVDVWNNLILCDIFDRVNSEDTEEDMMIWAAGNDMDASMNDETVPTRTVALFTNHPVRENTDLYVTDYEVQTQPAIQSRGNSIALSVYEENKKEYIDHYIADGDIERNEFTRFEYAGEVYGDYNYLLAERARDIYMKKIMSEIIVIHVHKPQLAINRGDQLRFVWYDNDAQDSQMYDRMEELGIKASSESLATEIGWLKDWDFGKEDENNPMRVNLQLSGQYTCVGQYISYNGETQTWDAWLYLTRPASKRPKMLNEDMTKSTNEENVSDK